MSPKILSKVIKVGNVSHYSSTENRDKKAVYYSYADIQFNDGWAETSKFLPRDFDLVYGKTSNGEIKSCWLSGSKWDGLRVKNDDIIMCWRKKEEVEEL